MYKLEKNSPYKNLEYNLNTYFKKTTKSLKGFAICGASTGILYGVLYGMNVGASTSQMIQNGGGEAPLVLFIATLCFARRAYKNFKSERKRWLMLTEAYGNEHSKDVVYQQVDLTRQETPYNYFDNNDSGGEDIGYQKVLKKD